MSSYGLDVLVLVSDGPYKTQEVTVRQYRLLNDVLNDHLEFPKYRYQTRFVCNEYDPNPSKTMVYENYLLQHMEYIQMFHPKVILCLGKAAFEAVGLANTKVTEIISQPQRSEWFGTNYFLDKRSKTNQRAAPVEPHPERGTLVLRNGQIIPLVSHKDIIIYPTHKHANLLTYGCNMKGIDFLIRQVKQIKYMLDNWHSFRQWEYKDYEPFIHFYRDPDPESVREGIERLKYWKNAKCFCFDTETAGYGIPKEAQLNPRHVEAKIPLIAFGMEDRVDVFNLIHVPQYLPYVKAALENEGMHLTWNGPFDIEFTSTVWGVTFGNHKHVDGMTCAYLHDSKLSDMGRGSMTLKQCSATFLPGGVRFAGYEKNAGISAALKSGDHEFLTEHEDEYMLYCGIDVWLNAKLNKLLWNNMNAKRRKLCLEYYNDMNQTLNKLHKRGILIDESKLDEYIDSMRDFVSKVEDSIHICINTERKRQYTEHRKQRFGSGVSTPPFQEMYYNIRSGKDLAGIAYDLFKFEPVQLTAKGERSVTTAYLQERSDHPFCKLMVDYKGFKKQLELLETVKKNTEGGRCRARYNVYQTASGRLSACNPNIQQVSKNKKLFTAYPDRTEKPPKPDQIMRLRPIWRDHEVKKSVDGDWQLVEHSPYLKSVFVADPGMTMIYADYSQLEINILANYIARISTDDKLPKAVREGRDIHSYTCSLVYSILKEREYTEEFIKAHKDEDPYQAWRQDCKSVIFKLIYGGTARSMAEEKGIPLEEAQKVFDAFLLAIPGIQHYMDHMRMMGKRHWSIESYAGHRRSLTINKYQRNSSKAKNISLNHPIQSSASFVVNQAMMKLDSEKKKIDPRSTIQLTVHDSIAYQVPEDKVREGLKCLIWCMENYVNRDIAEFLRVPVRIDLEHGENWNDTVGIKAPEMDLLRKEIAENHAGYWR